MQSMQFSRREHWSGQPFPSPGDHPNPRAGPRPPALQVDSLPAKPPGRPRSAGVGSLSLLLRICLTQGSTGVSCIAGGFFTSLATREALICTWMEISIHKRNKFYWFRGFGHLRRRSEYDHNNSPFCQFLFEFSLFDPTIFFQRSFLPSCTIWGLNVGNKMDSVRYFSKHQMTAVIFLLCNPGTSRYMVIAESQLGIFGYVNNFITLLIP